MFEEQFFSNEMHELNNRIHTAVATVISKLFENIWREIKHKLDIP